MSVQDILVIKYMEHWVEYVESIVVRRQLRWVQSVKLFIKRKQVQIPHSESHAHYYDRRTQLTMKPDLDHVKAFYSWLVIDYSQFFRDLPKAGHSEIQAIVNLYKQWVADHEK